MKKSTEMWQELDAVKAEMEVLRNEGKIEEAHAKIAEIKNLQKEIEVQEALEEDELKNFKGTCVYGSTPNIKEPKNMGEVKEMSGQLFKNAVMPHEQMAEKLKDNTHNDVDLGKLVSGVMTGNWSNATRERDYLNAIESTGDGKVLIPQRLSASIFDTARAKSAIFGKVPALQLTNGNLTVAKVAKDPKAYFVAEGEAIPFSDVTFAPVKLKSKILAMLVPVSEVLLKDGQNVGEALHMAMAGALAEAMDNALLYGDGDGTDEASAPKGILTYPDINKATFTDSLKYTDLVKGVKPVAKANLTATDAIMPTDEYYDLLSSTNANGDFLAPPKALEGVELDGSNNVGDGQAVVLDRNAVVVGVSPYLMFERGYTSDQFQKLQKTFRLYMGVDIALVNPNGVTHIAKDGVSLVTAQPKKSKKPIVETLKDFSK